MGAEPARRPLAEARRQAARWTPSSACAGRCASWTPKRGGEGHVRRRRRAGGRSAAQFLPATPSCAHRSRRCAPRERCRAGAACRSAERASDASLRALLRGALEESQRQREEIARLREELALAHGRVREIELDRRLRRT